MKRIAALITTVVVTAFAFLGFSLLKAATLDIVRVIAAVTILSQVIILPIFLGFLAFLSNKGTRFSAALSAILAVVLFLGYDNAAVSATAIAGGYGDGGWLVAIVTQIGIAAFLIFVAHQTVIRIGVQATRGPKALPSASGESVGQARQRVTSE